MNLKIDTYALGPLETNAYLVTDEGTRRCVIVDAPPDADEVLLPLVRERQLVLEAVLLTHGHWDHIATAHAFAKAGAPLYAHRADAACYASPEKFAPFYRAAMPQLGPKDFQPAPIAHWVEDGGKFNCLGREFEVRHVPGHCPGNVLFYIADEKLAFPGDAIFEGSVGRTDLPGGDWRTLLTSIRTKIYTLPDDTLLLPGHGNTSTVGQEKLGNPYARP